VNRLRVARMGKSDGSAGIDDYNLSILYSTNSGPLNERNYQSVSGLINGYCGQELVSAGSVNPGGTVQGEHHDYATQGFYSLTFDPVRASAIAIRIDKAPGQANPYIHYGVIEAEVYPWPVLNSRRGHDAIELSWSSFLAGYIVEGSKSIGPEANWRPVDSSPPSAVLGDIHVLVPVNDTAKYFRLSK